jgi:hypothetical protein
MFFTLLRKKLILCNMAHKVLKQALMLLALALRAADVLSTCLVLGIALVHNNIFLQLLHNTIIFFNIDVLKVGAACAVWCCSTCSSWASSSSFSSILTTAAIGSNRRAHRTRTRLPRVCMRAIRQGPRAIH